MSNILENYDNLQQQIKSICLQNNIDYPVELIAVSKTFPSTDILQIHLHSGHASFGENYPQELHLKAIELEKHNLQWHFIGNIQSNKIKLIAKHAAWVHSLDNLKHAISLNNNRDKNAAQLNVLIEVNISGDKSKHGLTNIAEIIELAHQINSLDNLSIRGLMGMSGATADINLKNQQFSQLKQLFNQLKAVPELKHVDTLSMGMSDDFELALKNGANMLRIGSLIFGKRTV